MRCILQMLVCLVVVGISSEKSSGPPLSSCTDMYPRGHKADSQTSPSIVTIALRNSAGSPATSYTAGEVITVTVATANPNNTSVYYRGLFVQARDTNCTEKPIGTFQIIGTSDFLKTMDCAGISQSAIAQKNRSKEYTQTFTWTAPTPTVGHVYLQATIVKNCKTFWTGVMSPFLRDASDTTDPKYCKVRTELSKGKTAETRATVAVVLLGLTIAVANVISFS